VKLTLLLLTLIPNVLFAQMLRVAVIDTGVRQAERFNICKNGLLDLTGTGIKDTHGHGTNVLALSQIFAKADKSKYCFDVIKYYVPNQGQANAERLVQGISAARLRGAHVISAAVTGFSFNPEEEQTLRNFVFKNEQITGLYVGAAGNDSQTLNPKYRNNKLIEKSCNVFPACYGLPGQIVIGNGVDSREPASSSNRGTAVDLWLNGNNHMFDGEKFSGTSQSTAIATGMIIALVARSNLYTEDKTNGNEAIRKSLEAIYYDAGADKIADRYVEQLKKDSPEFLTKVLTIIYPSAYTIRQGRITYRWTF